MEGKPTLSQREIARRIGVSHMTVSRALRNDPVLPVATRERVQKLARELGYRPNPLVHALMAHVRASQPVKSTATLAFLTGYPTRDGWRRESYVFREYFAGASARANQLGYRLEEVWTKEPGMTGRRLSDVLEARGIRGVLVGPVPAARGHLSLDWSRFAAATMGYSVWRPNLHRAAVDHYQVSALVLRQLKRQGHRRIGLAMPVNVDERTNHTYLGALLVYQRSVPERQRVPPFLPEVWQQSEFGKWYLKTRPDVVVVAGAGQVIGWLRHCGASVPEDVGYATLMLPGPADPYPYSGVDQQARLVGVAAVDLVVGQLHRNETGIPDNPRLVLIPGRWQDGATLRCR